MQYRERINYRNRSQFLTSADALKTTYTMSTETYIIHQKR